MKVLLGGMVASQTERGWYAYGKRGRSADEQRRLEVKENAKQKSPATGEGDWALGDKSVWVGWCLVEEMA
jgi:hypothetical protein